VMDVEGLTDVISLTVNATDGSVCSDTLENENFEIAFSSEEYISGLDYALGTSLDTNNSSCALQVITNTVNNPWARYSIDIDIASNGLVPGDQLLFKIDGNSKEGKSRIEVVEDFIPNTGEIGYSFGNDWSTYQKTITIPNNISKLSIWLFSNYGSSNPGIGLYDNLTVSKIINGGASLGNKKNSNDLNSADNAIINSIDEEFKIFPNPTSGILNINLSSYYDREVRIYIYNSINQVVKTYFFEKNHKQIEEIELLNLSNGLYYLGLQSNNNYKSVSFILRK
uniref:T9SS type A sorting domain-containing protein n=1 Tax=uncultured Maribacter sp. TaxID=431308 RepID=UPI002629A992